MYCLPVPIQMTVPVYCTISSPSVMYCIPVPIQMTVYCTVWWVEYKLTHARYWLVVLFSVMSLSFISGIEFWNSLWYLRWQFYQLTSGVMHNAVSVCSHCSSVSVYYCSWAIICYLRIVLGVSRVTLPSSHHSFSPDERCWNYIHVLTVRFSNIVCQSVGESCFSTLHYQGPLTAVVPELSDNPSPQKKKTCLIRFQ